MQRLAKPWNRRRALRIFRDETGLSTSPHLWASIEPALDDEIERSVDPSLQIHVALDNGSSHTSKYTKAWFDAHPRWFAHSTPPHASGVNQVELFFSILQRKVIRNGNFTSRDDLITKMLTFIAAYDTTATPFKWTYAADPFVA